METLLMLCLLGLCAIALRPLACEAFGGVKRGKGSGGSVKAGPSDKATARDIETWRHGQ